jgi:hypothetical protein
VQQRRKRGCQLVNRAKFGDEGEAKARDRIVLQNEQHLCPATGAYA